MRRRGEGRKNLRKTKRAVYSAASPTRETHLSTPHRNELRSSSSQSNGEQTEAETAECEKKLSLSDSLMCLFCLHRDGAE